MQSWKRSSLAQGSKQKNSHDKLINVCGIITARRTTCKSKNDAIIDGKTRSTLSFLHEEIHQ